MSARASPALPAEPAEPSPPTGSPKAPAAPSDAERETRCPLDLVSRAETLGILQEFAALAGIPVEPVRRQAEEFAGYWTIGGGAGKARRNWLGKLRQRLHELHAQGKLIDPDAPATRSETTPWTDPDPGPKGPVVPPPPELASKLRRVGRA